MAPLLDWLTVSSPWIWVAVWLPLTAIAAATIVVFRARWAAALTGGPPSMPVLAAFAALIVVLAQLSEPTGDEPHYLVMTQSLLRDGDLMVRDEYLSQEYREYYPYEIPDPHVTRVGGTWHPIHNFGLPMMAVAPFALGGRTGVVVMLAVISVAGIRVVWSMIRRAGGGLPAAGIATATAALTLPLVSLAGQVYPDVVAFLLVALSVWAFLAHPMGRREHVALALAVAVLPWLHVKYGVLGVGLLGAAGIVQGRSGFVGIGAAGILLAASVATWAAVSVFFFGIFPPGTDALVPQETGTVRWEELISRYFLSAPAVGLAGLFLDQQSGLFLASPVYALIIPGIALLRRSPRAAAAAMVVFLSVYLPAGFWGVWHAEGSSPARFLLPTVPILALLIAVVLDRAGVFGQRLFALLAVPSLAHGYLMLTLPSFVRYGDPATHHNYFVSVVERLAGIDLAIVLPSFRLVTPATWVTAAAYVMLIAVVTIAVVRADGRGVRQVPTAA